MTNDAAFKFSNGELRRGVVISQERTSRTRVVNVALGECIIKEEMDGEKANRVHKRKRRISQRSNVSDDNEEDIKVFEDEVRFMRIKVLSDKKRNSGEKIKQHFLDYPSTRNAMVIPNLSHSMC